jgi:hypothetical protein
VFPTGAPFRRDVIPLNYPLRVNVRPMRISVVQFLRVGVDAAAYTSRMATFGYTIISIVLIGTEKEVFGPAAQGEITAVTDQLSRRNRSNGESVRHAVRLLGALPVEGHSVAAAARAANPWPATTQFGTRRGNWTILVDPYPESFLNRHGRKYRESTTFTEGEIVVAAKPAHICGSYAFRMRARNIRGRLTHVG